MCFAWFVICAKWKAGVVPSLSFGEGMRLVSLFANSLMERNGNE